MIMGTGQGSKSGLEKFQRDYFGLLVYFMLIFLPRDNNELMIDHNFFGVNLPLGPIIPMSHYYHNRNFVALIRRNPQMFKF